MSELNNKSVENVIWFLGELAAGGSELIESDDFEVECDGGSSRTVSIAGLAEDAAAIIAKQANLISKINRGRKDQRSKTCVGRKCSAIDGVNHSAECIQDLDNIFADFK